MKEKTEIYSKNKKAFFNYEIVEKLECGIELLGSEVKSIREGRYSWTDSFVVIEKDELLLRNFSIQPYKNAGVFNHKEARIKKLLAHKQEIKKFKRKVEEKGMTIVPLAIYEKNNFIKIEIGLAKGKSKVDKKDTIKERDINRDINRELKRIKKAGF